MRKSARRALLGLAVGLGLSILLWWVLAGDPMPAAAPTIAVGAARETTATPTAAGETSRVERQPVTAAGAASTRLSGRVIDARTRAPVAGARVLVRDLESGEGITATPTEWSAETEAQGDFHQELSGTTVVSLEVTGAGYVPRKLPSVVVADDVEIELHPACRLLLDVRFDRLGDGSVLEPIPGAACRLVLDGRVPSQRTIQHGTTDARGEVVFALRGLQAHVVVETPDLPTFTHIYELEAGQDRLQVVLHPVGEVTGRVIDKDSGQPIAGATLTATYHESLRAVTDGDGSYRIPHDPTENSLWTVVHPGYAPVHHRYLPQAHPSARVADIELEASATVVGRIDGFQGEVELFAVSKQSWFVHQRFGQHASLAGAGPVRITGVPPREALVIEARDRHGHVGIIESRATTPGETVDFGILVPMATATLHGQLIGLVPSLPAVVRVRIKRDRLIVRDLSRGVTGSDYRITHLPAGQAEAWIEQEGMRGIVADIALAATDVSLDLDLGGRIHGAVRDEAGAGIEGVAVLVHYERAGVRGRGTARTDAAGRFVCAGLERTATHRVSLFGPGPGFEVLPKTIDGVIPGPQPVAFTLRKNAWTITGTVDAAILETVKAESLLVLGQGRNATASARVRDDGAFSLSVPHPGPWTLELHAINISGEQLGIDAVAAVDEIRNASPGNSVVFRRK